MNCLEFRRLLLIEPGSTDAAFTRHRQSCVACAAAVSRAVAFEQRLREATRVGVPENLASGVMLRHSFRAGESAWAWRGRRWLRHALAASVVLGALAGGLFYATRGPTLGQEVVALIDAAPYALVTDKTVSSEDVVAALQPVGLRVEGEIGEVTFASRCLIRGLLSGHLVLKGRNAPVTVFLIPRELVSRRESFRFSHLSGVLVPEQRGTIAIVAPPGEALDNIEAEVRAAVRWQV